MKIGSSHFYQYQNEVYDLNLDDPEILEKQQKILDAQHSGRIHGHKRT